MGQGHLEIVKLLLEKGAEVDPKVENSGMKPLASACGAGHFEIAKLLIEKGADAKEADKDGTNYLTLATCGPSRALVELLLERGADVNPQRHGGNTPLISAVSSENLAINSSF